MRKQLPLTKIGKAAHVMSYLSHDNTCPAHDGDAFVKYKTPVGQKFFLEACVCVFRNDVKSSVLSGGKTSFELTAVLRLMLSRMRAASCYISLSLGARLDGGGERKKYGRIGQSQYQTGSMDGFRGMSFGFPPKTTAFLKVSLQ